MEVQRIIQMIREPLELVLVFAGPEGGIIYWDSKDAVAASYVVRSPSLTGDSALSKLVGVVRNVRQALTIIATERPDLVLAAATAQAVPFGIAARILRTPLWFVESITRVRKPCRTGMLMSRLRLCTRIYYYWPALSGHLPRGICGAECGP
jgi:hypothetical protein